MILQDQEHIIRRLRQDMLSRWAITGLEVVLILLSWYVKLIQDIWLLLFVILLAVVILNFGIFLWLGAKKKVTILTEYLIRVFDIALITYVIVYTGGIRSPFYIIYILLISIEGLALSKERIIYDLLVSAFFYIVMITVTNTNIFNTWIINMAEIVVTTFTRLVFLILAAWISLSYVDVLLKRQNELVRTNTENVKLYEQVKELNKNLEIKVKAATSELSRKVQENTELYLRYHGLFIDVVKVLAAAVDVRDPYNRGHAERVTKFAQIILEELLATSGFKSTPELRGTLYMACMMQDIGRIALRDEILRKSGPLSEQEWVEMKKHPVVAGTIIEQIEELKPVAEAVLHHHERYDGSGYPKGLKGEQIPLISRILAVADAFDAMTSDRPFRVRKDDSIAIEELKKCIFTQFDPNIVNAFLKAYQKGKIVKI